ncbi:IS200/IS605 family transposase [Paenibacillus faecalis]|uniref:IS200/IS605 family transposase n=1 Tax=Paenibacillus faecalis TaxID=2079532 RepID=UPI000D10C7EB|nr:IS200/IS605 family transposase [Paenibacillus faecalis]
MANKSYSLAHTKWMCKYHIVFTPKYRRKEIYNQVRKDLIEIIKRLCKYKGGDDRRSHDARSCTYVSSDSPKISVSSFMGYLKGKSALMIFEKYANLKYKYGNRKFWAEGYYVSTVGLSEATVAKYIREREAHDQAVDKLSVKEYEDPFSGNRSKRK